MFVCCGFHAIIIKNYYDVLIQLILIQFTKESQKNGKQNH